MADAQAPTAGAMSYYDLLSVKSSSSVAMIEVAFRRWVARYRITAPVETLLNHDKHFKVYLNAYLILCGPQRAEYDDALTSNPEIQPILPSPLERFTLTERELLLARLACWRREYAEAMHALRGLLNREPRCAEAWALLGEIFLLVGRLENGIDAFMHAVAERPDEPVYAARLRHLRQVAAGEVELHLEISPEDEMLQHERQQRIGRMLMLAIPGLVLLVASCFLPLYPEGEWQYIPWQSVVLQTFGAFLFAIALAYGHFVAPFERVMVWNSVSAMDRARARSYPYGMIILITSVASMWLTVLTVMVLRLIDEDWPPATSFVFGLPVLANVALVLSIFYQPNPYWANTLIFGGNLPALAAILGWWVGSFGITSYD